jgi:hypothetical protein
MQRTLLLYSGHSFLGGRSVAFKVRTEAEVVLRTTSDTVVLDFDKVEGVSHSFADELLSSLTDLLGDRLCERVVLTNCQDSVYRDLESVAHMHCLSMPARNLSADICVA